MSADPNQLGHSAESNFDDFFGTFADTLDGVERIEAIVDAGLNPTPYLDDLTQRVQAKLDHAQQLADDIDTTSRVGAVHVESKRPYNQAVKFAKAQLIGDSQAQAEAGGWLDKYIADTSNGLSVSEKQERVDTYMQLTTESLSEVTTVSDLTDLVDLWNEAERTGSREGTDRIADLIVGGLMTFSTANSVKGEKITELREAVLRAMSLGKKVQFEVEATPALAATSDTTVQEVPAEPSRPPVRVIYQEPGSPVIDLGRESVREVTPAVAQTPEIEQPIKIKDMSEAELLSPIIQATTSKDRAVIELSIETRKEFIRRLREQAIAETPEGEDFNPRYHELIAEKIGAPETRVRQDAQEARDSKRSRKSIRWLIKHVKKA